MTDRNALKVNEACADRAEVAALAVTRFIAAGYMTGDAACWDAAYSCAESVVGIVDGPRLVAAMSGLMRALEVERREPWTFMPASCCRVTGDEALLLTALQAARANAGDRKRELVNRLTNSDDAPRLTLALTAAAALLDDCSPPAGFPGRAPASQRFH